MNVNVFMSMYFCLSLSSSLSQPMSLSPVSLSSFGERERERAGKEMFYARKYLLTQKKALMKTQGSKKSTRHTEKNNKVTYETLAYQ